MLSGKCTTTLYQESIITEEQLKFSRKIIEYGTPHEKRIFCPDAKCGAHIPLVTKYGVGDPMVVSCTSCNTQACRICKGKAHSKGVDCPKVEIYSKKNNIFHGD